MKRHLTFLSFLLPLLVAGLWLTAGTACAQPAGERVTTPRDAAVLEKVVTTPQDAAVFEKAVEALRPFRELPASELLYRTAVHFLGTPYVAGTLEKTPDTPVINLRETDCILFVEICTAITSLLKEKEGPTFGDYCDRIVRMRYRRGEEPSYGSRLHYTSEWILQNSADGLFREISEELGQPLEQEIDFMSRNSDRYPPLKDNLPALAQIRRGEIGLNGHSYFWVPDAAVAGIEDRIQTGDILCFVSKVAGLDISHVGIAYREGERVRFIHASTRSMKVVREPRTLLEYPKKGIRVLRFAL